MTYVLDRLGISSAETNRVTQIQNQIERERVRLIAEEELLVNETTLTFTLGNAEVSLPADVLEIITLYQHPNDVWRPATEQEIADIASGTGPTDPAQGIYIFEPPNTIRLPFAPTDTPVTTTIRYSAIPAALTDITAPTELPAHLHDLIAERVIYRIALSEEDQALAAGALGVVQELTASLHRFVARRAGRGRPYIVVRGLS